MGINVVSPPTPTLLTNNAPTPHLLPFPSSLSTPIRRRSHLPLLCSTSTGPQPTSAPQAAAAAPPPSPLHVSFRTLSSCKLGISRYPDFDYDGEGGSGSATCAAGSTPLEVSFDVGSLRIPPLTSATTTFLGLPLPPYLRIDIAPELLEGSIDTATGKVELEFRAKFWFSVGSIYKAPALLVGTRLTTEESKGEVRRGRGKRMDGEGRCRLVGVAFVDPIGDVFMDSFLGLPSECLAVLNARIGISSDASA